VPPRTPLEQQKYDEAQARKRRSAGMPGATIAFDLAKALLALLFLIVVGPFLLAIIFFGLQGLVMVGVPTLLVLLILAVCRFSL
jgi:hypothetical protein